MSNLTRPSPPPLVEGVDYVIEDGRWVFTAAFLRRRGTCCGSGCRNCPYRDGDTAPPDKPRPTVS